MKNTIYKKAAGMALCSLLIITCFLFTTCSNPVSGGEEGTGSFTIRIGGDDRAVWPPLPLEYQTYLHTITVSGGPASAGGRAVSDTI
jgi:hypothetical protein